MATNHAVSELVTCLKNGQLARKERVITSNSNMKTRILDILKKDGFIKDYEVFDNGSYEEIEITLSYVNNKAVIKDIEVLSNRINKKTRKIKITRKNQEKLYIINIIGE